MATPGAPTVKRLPPRYMAGPEQALFIARDSCATCHGTGRHVSPSPAVGTGPGRRPRMGDETAGQCGPCADALQGLSDSDLRLLVEASPLVAGSANHYGARAEARRRGWLK